MEGHVENILLLNFPLNLYFFMSIKLVELLDALSSRPYGSAEFYSESDGLAFVCAIFSPS